jgi:hypothetical protein
MGKVFVPARAAFTRQLHTYHAVSWLRVFRFDTAHKHSPLPRLRKTLPLVSTLGAAVQNISVSL